MGVMRGHGHPSWHGAKPLVFRWRQHRLRVVAADSAAPSANVPYHRLGCLCSARPGATMHPAASRPPVVLRPPGPCTS